MHPLIGNAYLREIQGLGIHFSVYINDKELAEIGRIDVAGRENRLGEILPAACIVIVIGGHVSSARASRRRWRGLHGWRVAIAANQMEAEENDQENRTK